MTLCRTTLLCLFLSAGLLAALGCQEHRPGRSKPAEPAAAEEAPGHSHERGTMLLADAGNYHALLTAHLSREGHELDIFFETTDTKKPTPVAIPVEAFTAQVRDAAGELREVRFECAPAAERPAGEKAGTCSHFVAKVPWLKPAEPLYVVVRLDLDGQETTVRWKDFLPQKYAHHVDAP